MANTTIINVPVQSVNGQTGIVNIDATDIGAAELVHTHVEADITDLGTYIEDAPIDGTLYGRQDGGWIAASSETGIEEAPNTGLPYLRRNEGWEQPSIVSSGISSTGVGIQIFNASAPNSYTIPSATISDAGVMSATDKTKLDGIETGAQVNVNSDWNSTSGVSEILNKPYVEDLFTADVRIHKTTAISFATIQTQIDSLPRNLNGYKLTIEFNEGIHPLLTGDTLVFDRFNSGSITVEQDPGDPSTSIWANESESFIEFADCFNIRFLLNDLTLKVNTATYNTTFIYGKAVNSTVVLYNSGFNSELQTVKGSLVSIDGLTSMLVKDCSFYECGPLFYLNAGTSLFDGEGDTRLHTFNNFLASGATTGVTFVGVGAGLSILDHGDPAWRTNVAGTSAIQIATV